MAKSTYGSAFLLISAIFFSTRYICASIGLSNSRVWSLEEFSVSLKNVPNSLLVLSIISLFIGLVFIIWGFLERSKR